jgi:predicted transcriptional regulator of viral defense system
MTRSQRDALLGLARRRGTLSARDAGAAGIHSQVLTRLVDEGVLERIARGQYRLAGRGVSEHHGLVIVAAVVPQGVICLLSALAFHGIDTQIPHAVWVAIEHGSREPVLAYPPVRVVRLSGRSFTHGVERHSLEGQRVRVYSVAKTLADVFKFRNTVGIDVALEALRESWTDRRFIMDDLVRAARVCRVERVMRPYLDAIVA